MKSAKVSGMLFTLIWLIQLVLISGCGKQSPVEAAVDNSKELCFIELEEGGIPFQKYITASNTVTPEAGGAISLEYKRGSAKEVEMVFEVLPNSINENAEILLGLDTKVVGGSIDLTFGPSGLKFNPYAKLNFTANGLNLNNVNTESLAFYYLDPSGDPVEMPCDDIIVDKKNGTLKVVNARIPHFSRYAIAFSR